MGTNLTDGGIEVINLCTTDELRCWNILERFKERIKSKNGYNSYKLLCICSTKYSAHPESGTEIHLQNNYFISLSRKLLTSGVLASLTGWNT